MFYFQTASKVTTTVCLIFQKTHVTRAPPWIFCWPNSPPEADSEEVSESEIKHHISLERRRWALNRFGGLMIALFQFLLLKSRSKTIDVKKNATCKYTSKCMQDTFIELVHTWFQADYTTIDSTCLKLKKKKSLWGSGFLGRNPGHNGKVGGLTPWASQVGINYWKMSSNIVPDYRSQCFWKMYSSFPWNHGEWSGLWWRTSRTSTIFGFGTGKQKAPYVFSHNIYTTMTVCLEAILKYDPGCAIQISSLVWNLLPCISLPNGAIL